MTIKLTLITAGILLALSPTAFAANTFFTVSSSGSTLTIQSNIPNHTYLNAGIKVSTSGYSLANPGTDCTLASNGYCLFSTSNSIPKTIELAGPTGNVNFTLCLNGLGPLSCQSYTASVTASSSSRYAYIVSSGNNLVKKCAIGLNGTLSGCVNLSSGLGLNTPIGIALNSAGDIAYITNLGTQSVLLCAINTSTGSFDSCSESGFTSSARPISGLALSPDNHFIYITKTGNNTVSQCSVSLSDGTLSSCSTTGSGFNYPLSIAFNPSGSMAYVTNGGGSTVSRCSVTSGTGELTRCTGSGNTGSAFSYPVGVAVNNDGEFAYITNQINGAISQCPIDLSTGSFGACSYGGDVEHPLAITLNEEDGLAYVSGVNNTIYLCPIETWDQSISSCTDSGVTGVSSSYSIAISQ